jgi:4-carboxymuconolactone decarboxylase
LRKRRQVQPVLFTFEVSVFAAMRCVYLYMQIMTRRMSKASNKVVPAFDPLSRAPKAANDLGAATRHCEDTMDKALRDKGLANRKAVLGEDYVNKSMASADSFNGPFQEILNEYCWGMIWSDERLPKKTRSMLNLVMLACLNRMHEWELHLKGALRNGVSKDEIQAIIHQIAVYAGVPLAVECFRLARKVFAEVEKGT